MPTATPPPRPTSRRSVGHVLAVLFATFLTLGFASSATPSMARSFETTYCQTASGAETNAALVSIDESGGKKTYTFGFQNNDKKAISFVAIALPNGVTPTTPADNATYTSAQGATYNVEITNTNGNPGFRSIKFEYVSGHEMKKGSYDAFSFTLPSGTMLTDPANVALKYGTNTEVYPIGTTCGSAPPSRNGECIPTIDFDTAANGQGLAAGTRITNQFAAYGLTISTNDANRPAMIFDSANPTGGDDDLGTPNQAFGGPGVGTGGGVGKAGANENAQDKVLIISEDNDANDPDDNAKGGTIIFAFDQDTRIDEVDILDVDDLEAAGTVVAYDVNGAVIKSEEILALGDNSYQAVVLGVSGVRRLEVNFPSSGAVAEIVSCATQPANLGSIGDTIFFDANRNGVQDNGEGGIQGVVVKLKEGAQVIDMETTDANGFYTFPNLPASTYTVDVDETTLPATYTLTTGNEPMNVVLAEGQDFEDADFGYAPPAAKQIDLELTKTVDQGSVTVGDDVTFTLSLVNKGPDAATGVKVLDALPAGLSFVSASSSDYDGGTGVWNVGSLAKSGTATLTITATVSQAGTFKNVAQVKTANEGDVDSTPNNDDGDQSEDDEDFASVTGTAKQIDLELTKTVDQGSVTVGDDVTFTLSLLNKGPDAATGVKVLDALPAGLSFVSASSSDYDDGTGVWNVGSLAKSGTATLTITATTTATGTFDNVAQVKTANEGDVDSTPNNDDGDQSEDDEDTASVMVAAPAKVIDLSVTKTVNKASVTVGDDVTFTIKVANAGPDAATGVKVLDALPAGLSFVSASSSDYDDGTGVWNVGSLAKSGTATLTITATVSQAGTFKNVAQVKTANEGDVDSTPNNDDGDQSEDDEDFASVTGTAKQIDLELTKTVDQGSVTVGDDVTFTLSLVNKGPDTATGVKVLDALPAGLSFVSASSSDYDGGTGVWNVGSLAKSGTATLTITATVSQAGTFKNVAQVKTANEGDVDSTPNNDDGDQSEDDEDNASVTGTPAGPALIDLALTKTVDDPAPNVGDMVTFTITVENESAVDATGVEVTDTLPAGLTPGAASDGGSVSGQTVTWTIGALAANTGVTRTITATVSQAGTFKNIAQVSAANEGDVDSTPNNDDGDQSEDDEDFAVVTTTGSSGGGNAGVESDGGMALKLAERLFVRRTDALTKTTLRAAPAPSMLTAETRAASLTAGVRGKSGGFNVAAIAPENGPLGSVAYETTPSDLLGITNATSIFAADYVRTDGRRIAALFSTTSEIDLYDHTKQTCDRLAGGLLNQVSTLAVEGPDGQARPFILSELRQPDGSIDYAVTFVAYRSGNTYTVDSRYVPDTYEVPGGIDEIVNVQLWAVTPGLTRDLAETVLARLAATGTVTFENDTREAPGVYVRTGRYEQGVLSLDLANATGAAQTVTIAGTVALTEADAQNGNRVAFERTLDIADNWDGRAGTAFAFDQPIFDVAFTVTSASGDLLDRAYSSDGAWGTNAGNATIQTFEVYEEDRDLRSSRQVFDVARDIYVSGTVTDWASAFRFLRPGGQPVDLAQMQHLDLTLSGQGTVQVVLEKASVEGGQQYGTEIALTAQPRAHRIRFADLTRAGGSTGFTGDDITAVVFYVIGNGRSAKRFDLIVQDAQFGGASSVANEGSTELPADLMLGQSYPNPFAGSTVIPFDLPESANVRLTVFDLLGRTVATLADGTMPSGRHEVRFDAGDLASGTYLYRLETPGKVQTKTLTVLR